MPKFFALTSKGLGKVLEEEIRSLGLEGVGSFQGGVQFEGPWSSCYLANLKLRTATRVLHPILEFRAVTNEELYQGILQHDYSQWIDPNGSIRVDASVAESPFKDQRFVAMKVKDAVVDQFRDKFGMRPNVEKKADLILHVRIYKDQVTVSVDTSGDGLFKRGYRKESVPAPVKEHVAAGLIRMTKWDGKCTIVDPMCGSGTFLIEAALQALNIAPGSLRAKFAFEKFKNFDAAAWEEITSKSMDEELETLPFKFYGFDEDREAIKAAKINVVAAGVGNLVHVYRRTVALLSAPTETATEENPEPLPIKGIVIVNPPYGERLLQDEPLLFDAYKDLAYALKTHFQGWTAWVLTNRHDASKLMGMKASERYEVMNGPIECFFLKFDIRRQP